jgi:4-amino-4-deoxy-L-arabinose transferase-like glycosyltransferase
VAGSEGDRERQVPLLSWAWWGVAGAAIGLGIVSLLTIGVLFLAVGVSSVIAGARARRLRNRSASMGLVGAAAAPLLLAWLNRDGPGTVCRSDGHGGGSCEQEWSPWPFVVVAILLLAAGVLLARRAGRTGSTA